MPYDPLPDLSTLGLADIARLAEARKLPPVELWHPERVGNSAMGIKADGRWFHEGGEITRPAMVRAFSTLVRADAEGQHWLVTPAEKLSIEVEDAAFQAVDVKQDGDALIFRLNTDEFVIAGPDHPLIARGSADMPAIYLAVRHGTEARINRSTWGQLVEIALAENELAENEMAGSEGSEASLAVSSHGARFPLVPQ